MTSPRRRRREPPPQSHRADVPLRRGHRRLLRPALEADARRAHPDLPDDLPLALLRRHRGGVGDVRVSTSMKGKVYPERSEGSGGRKKPVGGSRHQMLLRSAARSFAVCAVQDELLLADRAAAVVVSIAGAIGARTVAHGFSRGNAGSFIFEPASAGDRQGQPSVGPLPPAEAGLDELNRPASPRLKPWATALNHYAVTARRSVHLSLRRRKRRLHAQDELK